MSGVFISYRREDSAAAAQRLRHALGARFGADSVFIDVEDIGLGDNFAEVIDEKVGFCDALIAVIGPRWLSCADSAGRRRLDDPADWVRLEIASALSRGLRVFPVLVDGASLPFARDLPPPLTALVQHQALDMRGDRFEQDVARLAQSLDPARKYVGPASLWLSIITRRHRALDPLDLHKPETLRKASRFLLGMLLIESVLRLPVAAVPGPALTQIAYVLAHVVANGVQWLSAGFAWHFAMAAFGGRAKLQRSMAAFCYLTAYAPLIALAQIPVWGLNMAIARDVANLAWTPVDAGQKMQEFIAALGPFGMARIGLAFVAATYLWWRALRSVFDAFRSLHRLSRSRALVAFAAGLIAVLTLVALVITPYFGMIYQKFLGAAG